MPMQHPRRALLCAGCRHPADCALSMTMRGFTAPMRMKDLDITAQRLVAIAVKAGCLAIDAATGEIEGLYDSHAEELAYMMVSAAARKGELGFVDR